MSHSCRRILNVLTAAVFAPGLLLADEAVTLEGVWERTLQRPKTTEVLSITRDLAGDFSARLRFIREDREVARYEHVASKQDERGHSVTSSLKLVNGSVGKWQPELVIKSRMNGQQLLYTAVSRGAVRGGRLSRVVDPGKRLIGRWVAQDANHKFVETWAISRTQAGKWDIRIRYTEGGRDVGLGHGDSFELRGDILTFITVLDRRPAGNWSNNRATIRPTGKKIRQTWTAGKHKGKTTLARIIKQK